MVETGQAIFCPDCRSMTSLLAARGGEDPDKGYYDKYDPPSASTIYCKWKNIPYQSFRYSVGSGMVSIAFTTVERKLEESAYNCSNCTYWIEGFCNKKGIDSGNKAICRSYEIRPGSKQDKKHGQKQGQKPNKYNSTRDHNNPKRPVKSRKGKAPGR